MRPWITGTGVCSNSIESATPTNRKLCWLDSWALWVLMFAFAGAVLKATSPSHYHSLWQAAGSASYKWRFDEICDVIYWRLLAAAANEWERWAIWKSNCKNRFLENFFDNITILLNYYVRYFSATSGNPAACGKRCLLTNAWRFFADLFTYTDKVNNKCCFKLQLTTCLLLSALRCIDCVRCVGGRCFTLPLCRCFRCIVSVCSAHD